MKICSMVWSSIKEFLLLEMTLKRYKKFRNYLPINKIRWANVDVSRKNLNKQHDHLRHLFMRNSCSLHSWKFIPPNLFMIQHFICCGVCWNIFSNKFLLGEVKLSFEFYFFWVSSFESMFYYCLNRNNT